MRLILIRISSIVTTCDDQRLIVKLLGISSRSGHPTWLRYNGGLNIEKTNRNQKHHHLLTSPSVNLVTKSCCVLKTPLILWLGLPQQFEYPHKTLYSLRANNMHETGNTGSELYPHLDYNSSIWWPLLMCWLSVLIGDNDSMHHGADTGIGSHYHCLQPEQSLSSFNCHHWHRTGVQIREEEISDWYLLHTAAAILSLYIHWSQQCQCKPCLFYVPLRFHNIYFRSSW